MSHRFLRRHRDRPSPFHLLGADRRTALLAGIEPGGCRGLEFGPLTSPLVGREEGAIEYVDHATTADLRLKYAADPQVDVARIVEVDHVLEAGGLPASIPAAVKPKARNTITVSSAVIASTRG